ncbi:DUF3307 domain-containing protein [Clostridium sp. WILCCON 0269]|uniref:DUF3307 domain-containing protein n=1 Tax=Candidatus Clostridium eludens TaxID=3381663 RepID=A0ABW8SG95_9CLOT
MFKIEIYVILLFFHLVGDIILQRNFLIEKIFKCNDLGKLKRQNKKFIVLHVILYTLSITVAFLYLKLFSVYRLLIIFASHFLIDYIKCYKIVYQDYSMKYYIVNFTDQSLHVGILFIIVSL